MLKRINHLVLETEPVGRKWILDVHHTSPGAMYFYKNVAVNQTVSGESVLLVLRMISSSRWKRKVLLINLT